MANYTAVFSGTDGDKKPSVIEVMQNATETALVFDCYFEDGSAYTFAAGDVVTGSYLDNATPANVYGIVGTITPTISGSTMSWARDETDVGTPGEYTLAFKVVSAGADPDYSLLIVYRVIATPDGTAVPALPLVGVTAAEAAWLTVAYATVPDATQLADQADLALKVDKAGDTMTGDLTMSSASLVDADTISLNTSYTETGAEAVATRFWNAVKGTTTLITADGSALDDGQELRFYGKASGAITNGDFVQFAGAQGDHVLFKKVVPAEVIANRFLFLGVATTDLANGDFGNVVWIGYVNDINTTGWSQTDLLYMDNTTGQGTNVEPPAGDVKILAATVIKEETSPAAANGSILVRPTFYARLTELEDVNGTALTTSGQIVVWDQDNGYFDATENINDFIQSVVAGTNVTVDATDPQNPIVSAGGGGGDIKSDGTVPMVAGLVNSPSSEPAVWNEYNPALSSSKKWYWPRFGTPTANTGDPTRKNLTAKWGYNIGSDGQQDDATDHSFYAQFEDYYSPYTAKKVSEYHFNFTSADGSTRYRPFHIEMHLAGDTENPLTCTTTYKSRDFIWTGMNGYTALQLTPGTSVADSTVTFAARATFRGDSTTLFQARTADNTKTIFTADTTNLKFKVTSHSAAGFQVVTPSDTQAFAINSSGQVTIGSGGESGMLYIFNTSNQPSIVLRAFSGQTAPMLTIATNTFAAAFRFRDTGAFEILASLTTDTAPADDTTIKKFSIQKLSTPPTNAAYVPFQNNPGSDTFYLVMEEG